MNAAKLANQKLEEQTKQIGSDAKRKDRDFALAIGSRDDAVKEAQKLMGHIEAVEDRERSKVKKYHFICDEPIFCWHQNV